MAQLRRLLLSHHLGLQNELALVFAGMTPWLRGGGNFNHYGLVAACPLLHSVAVAATGFVFSRKSVCYRGCQLDAG